MTVITYGAFPGGAMSEFGDTSQNAFSPWVVTSTNGLAAGKYKAKFLTSPSIPILSWDNISRNYRIHALASPGSVIENTFLQEGVTFYRPLSIRWVRTPAGTTWAGDEIHSSGSGPLANGSVPLNGGDTTSGGWTWIIRGGGSPSVSGSYTQYSFGARSIPWQELSDDVTVNEWLHTMAIYTWSSSATTGRYALWACHHGGQMVNIVPERSIATCFPSPITHYPMMSLYSEGDGNTREIEYCGGAYCSTLAEAQAFQAAEIGYDPWSVGGGGGGGGGTPEPDSYLGGVFSGTFLHGSQANKQRCYKATVVTSGTVNAIGTKRTPSGSGTETVRFAVWDDNGSGTDPSTGALLGSTAEVSFTGSSAAGNYSTDVTSPFAVTAGDIVWIGEIDGGTPNVAFVDANTTAGAFRLMDATYSGGPVAWNTSTDASYDLDMAIWLEGTPTSGAAPVNIVAPAVTGTAKVGSTLAVSSTGTWTGATPTFTYQWQRSNGGDGWTNIASATSATYTVTEAERGVLVRCAVTATNSYGSTVGNSNATSAVTTAKGARTASSGHRSGGRSGSGRRVNEGGGG